MQVLLSLIYGHFPVLTIKAAKLIVSLFIADVLPAAALWLSHGIATIYCIMFSHSRALRKVLSDSLAKKL